MAARALLCLALLAAAAHAQITMSAPGSTAVYTAGDELTTTWTVNSGNTLTNIDIFLIVGNSINIAATMGSNVPINAGTMTWQIPSVFSEGTYWIAAVPSGQYSIVGHTPPRGSRSWGSVTFQINKLACTTHDMCGEDQYCDEAQTCWACAYCHRLDSIDGRCPVKCGGTGTDPFALHEMSAASEEDAVGTIDDIIEPGCARYNSLEVVTDPPTNLAFAAGEGTNEPNRMTKRLLTKLTALALLADAAQLGVVTVLHAYEVANNPQAASLHYAARAADITIANTAQLGELAQLAVGAGLDFVFYKDAAFIHVSVIPEPCQKPLDVVFLLDGSGSIDSPSYGGASGNFVNKVLGFVKEVVTLLAIGEDQTRVGVATFSGSTTINFHLDHTYDKATMLAAINAISYPKGATYTADGIDTVRTQMLTEAHGMRPLSEGVSRIVVVMTDGKANAGQEPGDAAAALQAANVNVFAMGVGVSVATDELESIASGDGAENVFLIKSFDRINEFVEQITQTTCDAPAILTAGDRTLTWVEECEWVYFTPACAQATNLVVTVRETSGDVHVYVSYTNQHPGPFDHVASSLTGDVHEFTITRNAGETFPVYVGVRGAAGPARNEFTIDVFSDIFDGVVEVTKTFDEDVAVGTPVYTPPPVTGFGNLNLLYTLPNGNINNAFAINPSTGAITVAKALDRETVARYELVVLARDQSLTCLSGGIVVFVNLNDLNDNSPTFSLAPYSLNVPENTEQGTLIETIQATDADGTASLTYSLVAGPVRRARRAGEPTYADLFAIDPASGELTAKIDFTGTEPSPLAFAVSVTDGAFTATAGVTVTFTPVTCPAGSFSADGSLPCTTDTPCAAGQWEAAPTTSTNPRDCRNATECVLGQTYETTLLTAQADRVCSPTHPCNFATHYRTADATLTSDFACAPLTPCGPGEQEVTAPTETSNRVCSDIDDCAGEPCLHGGTCTDTGANAYECACVSPWTGTNCDCGGPGTYTPTGASPCFPWTECVLGQTYETVAPSGTNDRTCGPVTDCDYNTHFRTALATLTANTQCQQLSACDAVGVEYEAQAPTDVSDRVCLPVADPCGEDETETQAPTATQNRVCTPNDDCAPNPCENGGTCTDGVNSYTCACAPGYHGATCACAPGEFRDAANGGACTPHTVCDPATQFESQAPTQVSDRACSALVPCTADEYIVTDKTATSNFECAALTVCNPETQFEKRAPTLFTDRTCRTATVCQPGEAETRPLTATADRRCAQIDDCDPNPCLNGGQCFDGVNAYTCQCKKDYEGVNCEIFDSCQFTDCHTGTCTNTAEGATCTCPAPAVGEVECTDACCKCSAAGDPLSTNVADGVCLTETEAKEQNNAGGSSGGSSASSLVPAIAVAAVVGAGLVLFLLLLLARSVRRQRREAKQDPEQQLAHDGAFNPLYAPPDMAQDEPVYSEFRLKKAAGGASNPLYGSEQIDYEPFYLGARPPYELALKNDPAWQDFRRCVSFDWQYYGNQLLALDDRQLRRIYRALSLQAPGDKSLSQLRQVGERFLYTQVSDESDPRMHGEVVEFLACALADVLVEVAINFAARLDRRAVGEELYEAFYAAIDDYLADANPYLAPQDGGHMCGIYEELDPVYAEGYEGGDYTEVEPVYAMGEQYDDVAGARGARDDTYDLGAGGDAVYALGNVVSGDAIYDCVQRDDEADGEAIYAMGDSAADGGEAIYAMGGADSSEAIYAVANQEDADDGEAIYAMATVASDNEDGDGDAIYALGDGDAIYDTATMSLEDALDPDALKAMENGGSIRTVLARTRSRKTYKTEAIYDNKTGYEDDGEAIYSMADASGGEEEEENGEDEALYAYGEEEDDGEAIYDTGAADDDDDDDDKAVYAKALPRSSRNSYAAPQDALSSAAPEYDAVQANNNKKKNMKKKNKKSPEYATAGQPRVMVPAVYDVAAHGEPAVYDQGNDESETDSPTASSPASPRVVAPAVYDVAAGNDVAASNAAVYDLGALDDAPATYDFGAGAGQDDGGYLEMGTD